MNNFTVAAIFSDNCVLQRNKVISIFGTVNKNCTITVCLYNKDKKILCENQKQITTSSEIKWEVQLGKQESQENCTLSLLCVFKDNTSSSIEFNNIAIGEVWIAGGQSNMEFELQNCTEGPDELSSKSAGKNVRFYYTKKIGWMDEKFYEAEKQSCWETWESEGKKAWSAIGYFFGKKLAADCNCTVGIIGCNWGGTSASAWMKQEYLEKDKDLNTYLTEYAEATSGKTTEQQCKEYEDYEIEFAKWNEGFSKLWEKDHNISWETAEKTLGKNPWPGPASCKNPYRPCGLYSCMLERIMPYTSKGVIWYQGESDDHKPNMYYKLFSTMIENWRTDWKNEKLPFIFVQLPNHRYQADKDFKHWCRIREAQQKIHDTIKNAWMTVALDKGQFSDIHPKAKKVVAERMENIALEKVYCKPQKKDVFSPLMKDYFICNDKIILTFDHASSGFEIKKDEQTYKEYVEMEKNQGNTVPQDFTGFEIAGEDKIYYPAKFEFGKKDDANTITLWSEKVNQPRYARYAWFNYGPVTVFGKSGLPLAPFRTSNQDCENATEHAKIQQIMTVAE